LSDLADAPNPTAAGRIEQDIWEIWLQAPDPRVDEWLNEARAAASSGASAPALEIFDRITSEYPDFAEGWNQRAIMHFLLGDFEKSLSDIVRTLELEPRHFGALAGSGQCYFHLELYRESLNAFEAALQVNPWLSSARRQVEMLRAYLKERQTPI
jgi:tetratricopeptide (TPR) repeat protein